MISDYLESLAGALSFDQSLSQCVRQEVEDHLREAIAADPAGGRLKAERRAIARFGDPHVIAAQFAVVSVARRIQKVGVGVMVAIAAVFIAMKARVAWYEAMQWTMSNDLRAVSGLTGSIDRYAFWLSVIIGIVGWVYIGSRSIPPALPAYRKQIRRCLFVCTAATGALIVAVVGDALLTAFRLHGTGLPIESLVPIVSMAIEIACAGVLVIRLCRMVQRVPPAATLLRT
jgi:hypothetical protein